MATSDTRDVLRKRFWALKKELDELEPGVMAAREKYNAMYAKHSAEQQAAADAYKAHEAKTQYWAKKQELADIAKFLRDPETGVAKMGPRPS